MKGSKQQKVAKSATLTEDPFPNTPPPSNLPSVAYLDGQALLVAVEHKAMPILQKVFSSLKIGIEGLTSFDFSTNELLARHDAFAEWEPIVMGLRGALEDESIEAVSGPVFGSHEVEYYEQLINTASDLGAILWTDEGVVSRLAHDDQRRVATVNSLDLVGFLQSEDLIPFDDGWRFITQLIADGYRFGFDGKALRHARKFQPKSLPSLIQRLSIEIDPAKSRSLDEWLFRLRVAATEVTNLLQELVDDGLPETSALLTPLFQWQYRNEQPFWIESGAKSTILQRPNVFLAYMTFTMSRAAGPRTLWRMIEGMPLFVNGGDDLNEVNRLLARALRRSTFGKGPLAWFELAGASMRLQDRFLTSK